MGIPGLVLLLAATGSKGMILQQNTEAQAPAPPLQRSSDIPAPQCFCLPAPGQDGGLVSLNAPPTPPTTPGKCVFCVPVQTDSILDQMSSLDPNNPLNPSPWSNFPGLSSYQRPHVPGLAPSIYQDVPGIQGPIPNFPGLSNYPGGPTGIPGVLPNVPGYPQTLTVGPSGVPGLVSGFNPYYTPNTPGRPFVDPMNNLNPRTSGIQDAPLMNGEAFPRLRPVPMQFANNNPLTNSPFGPQNSLFGPQNSPFEPLNTPNGQNSQLDSQNLPFSSKNPPFGPQNHVFGSQKQHFIPLNSPFDFGPQNQPFIPQNSPFGSQNLSPHVTGNTLPGPGNPFFGPSSSLVGPSNSQFGPGNSPFGPGNPQLGPIHSSQFGPNNSPFGPGNSPFGPGNPQLGPISSQFGPSSSPFGPGNSPFGPGNSPFGTQNPGVQKLPLIGPQNSPFGPLNPQLGPSTNSPGSLLSPFQPTSSPIGAFNPFIPQLHPSQQIPSQFGTLVPQFGPNLPPFQSSPTQFGPPISPFGPFSPQPVSPFGPFLPPIGPTGFLNQMSPAGIRSSNCPPFLQQLCSQPKLNFLAPMCAPGTSSSPFQPCISRSLNGICPPMTVCVSSLPVGGQNGPVQPGMGQYGNVFKPQVNLAEATIGQLASQISRQLGSRTSSTASALESASGSASSQAQQSGSQSSTVFSSQQLLDGNFGDQIAGVLSRRQLSPTSTTKVSTLMRSLAD